jgi:DNA-binding transcriptional LysR family regulator
VEFSVTSWSNFCDRTTRSVSLTVYGRDFLSARGRLCAKSIRPPRVSLKAILRRVETGKLDIGLGLFQSTPGVRRVPFFRFALMVIRPETGSATQRARTPWSALQGQTLISLTPKLRELADVWAGWFAYVPWGKV